MVLHAEWFILREFVWCCTQKGSFCENSYGAARRKVRFARIRMVLHAERSILREFVWCCMQNGSFCENSYGAVCRMVHFARIRMVLYAEWFILREFIRCCTPRYTITVVIKGSSAPSKGSGFYCCCDRPGKMLLRKSDLTPVATGPRTRPDRFSNGP